METEELLKQNNIPNKIDIQFNSSEAMISFGNINFDAENPISPDIKVIVEKQQITIEEGKSYVVSSVLIDPETPKMIDLATKAENLKDLPEEERIDALMKLFRENIHYAYNTTVDDISKTDPELAEWISTHTGVKSHATNVPLSEIIEKKYGVCPHLSVAYLWLAQKAGLEGVILNSDTGKLKNIKRTDNDEKLFKSVEIGEPVPAHSWVEIKLSDGRWIPVDPSTQLTGTTEEKFKMFENANYIAIGYGLDVESKQKELGIGGKAIEFKPGQARAEGSYHLSLRSIQPRIVWGKDSVTQEMYQTTADPLNTPYSGLAEMQIKCEGDNFTNFYGNGLSLVSVEEDKTK